MTMQYHMDSHKGTYKREFQSEVTAIYPGIVELEETAFYHLGGGQPPDTGKLVWKDGESLVYDVRKKNTFSLIFDRRYLHHFLELGEKFYM